MCILKTIKHWIKEMENDAKKWKDTSYAWIGRILSYP